MREIKFRAWDESGKNMYNWDWVSGCFFSTVLANDRFIPMQYTGLKDKNGKEIYEGDIVAAEGMYNDVVVFQNACFEAEGGNLYESIATIPVIYGLMEVIGNIYENPELLEKNG